MPLNAQVTTPTLSTSSTPAAAPIKDRLTQALDAAQGLSTAAEWLQAEAADLFSELKDIAREAAAPDMSAAIDAAAWVDSAAANIEGELTTLVNHLFDVTSD